MDARGTRGWRVGRWADGRTGRVMEVNPLETNPASFSQMSPSNHIFRHHGEAKELVPRAPPTATDSDAPACLDREGHHYGHWGTTPGLWDT